MSRRTIPFLRHALAPLPLAFLPALATANSVLLPPPELSAWGMFMQADIVVKTVMVGLLLASVITWTLWLVKSHELRAARAALREPLAVLAEAESLSGVRRTLAEAGPFPAAVQAAADQELRFSEGLPAEGVKERLQLALGRIEAASVARLNQGTGVLATIGATAPFVGLFGTVWGIMNSFIGIAQTQTTNLSVVAPGIAEALLATALGLVAAIPAVVLYNQYGRGLGDYRARAIDLTTAVLRLVSRDLDRGPGTRLTEVPHGNVRTA